MQASTHLQCDSFGSEPEFAPGNPAIGALFLSFFGTVWLLLGCLCNSVRYEWAAVASGVVGVGIFAGAMMLTRRLKMQRPARATRSAAEVRRDRVFNAINAGQWIIAGAAVTVLNLIGHPEWIMASIILVVGLHFFPLAHLFRRRSLFVLGALVVLIAVVLPQFVDGGPQSVALPLSNGCVLLAFAALSLYQARLQLRG